MQKWPLKWKIGRIWSCKGHFVPSNLYRGCKGYESWWQVAITGDHHRTAKSVSVLAIHFNFISILERKQSLINNAFLENSVLVQSWERTDRNLRIPFFCVPPIALSVSSTSWRSKMSNYIYWNDATDRVQLAARHPAASGYVEWQMVNDHTKYSMHRGSLLSPSWSTDGWLSVFDVRSEMFAAMHVHTWFGNWTWCWILRMCIA